MSKRDKLRRKLRNNPKGVKFSDLETLLVRVKESHHFYQYQHGEIKVIMAVPVHGNQVKVQYVKDSIALLDELFPEIRQAESDMEEDDVDE